VEVEEMTDPAKVRRHAERVRELVAQSIRTQIKDPRLGMITITDSRLTNDLREATVYYTVLGDATERQATAMALESGKGLLRSIVGRRSGLRHAPSLTFVHGRRAGHRQADRRSDRGRARRGCEGARVGRGRPLRRRPQPYRVVDEDQAREESESI
jgi:ribosome-binding factor A